MSSIKVGIPGYIHKNQTLVHREGLFNLSRIEDEIGNMIIIVNVSNKISFSLFY